MTERAASKIPADSPKGMSAAQAKVIEFAIIALCLVALLFVFQPFSQRLFSIGAALVVVGGLAFNLIPFCRPGIPLRKVLNVALIVIVILCIVTVIAIGSAYLYGIYFVG